MSAPLAWKNTFHHKGKLILSVLSIGASLAMILLLLGFREGLYAALTAYANNLGVDLIVAQSGVKGIVSSSSALPIDIHAEIEELAGANEAGHIITAGVIFARGDTKMPIILIGYEPNTDLGEPWKLGQGRTLQKDGEILLDTWLAQRSDIKIGDGVDLLGRQFEVVGLTRETASWMSPYVFISLKDAQETLGLVNAVSFHLVQLPDGADNNAAAEAVESQVEGVDVIRPNDIADVDRRAIATVMDRPISVLLMVGIIIGVAVMGLTSYTAVTDRMREYSLLKAVGANRFQLSALIVKEGLYVGGSGLVVGIGLAYLSAVLIMANFPQFNVLIRSQSVALASALALGMTLVSALLPMRRLAAIDPIEAFKS